MTSISHVKVCVCGGEIVGFPDRMTPGSSGQSQALSPATGVSRVAEIVRGSNGNDRDLYSAQLES